MMPEKMHGSYQMFVIVPWLAFREFFFALQFLRNRIVVILSIVIMTLAIIRVWQGLEAFSKKQVFHLSFKFQD